MSAYDTLILSEPSLQSYWKLAETAGTSGAGSVADSQDGITGTPANVTFGVAGNVSGDSDTAANFNGTTSGIDLSDVYDFPATSPFSVEVVCKVTATDANRRIVSKEGTPAGTREGWSFGVAFDQFQFSRIVGGVAVDANSGVGTIAGATTWRHVVGTYDGTNIRIYNQNVLLVTAADARSLVGNAQLVSIGYRQADASRFYAGDLQKIAIYNAELTQAQITAHYNAFAGITGGGPQLRTLRSPYSLN